MSDESAIVPAKQAEVAALVTWAKGVSITTVAERDAAVERGKMAKALGKWFAEHHADPIKKAKEAYDSARAALASVADPLKEVETIIKAKQGAFDAEQARKAEQERIRLQAIADEEARRAQAALLTRADKLKTPEKAEALREQAAAIVAPAVTVAAPVKAAGTNTAKVWDFEIVDPALIPREYLLVDEVKVRKITVAGRGTIQIPGVRMFEKPQVRW